MSLIHDQSCECSTSPLELFRVRPTQTAVEKTSEIEYQPLTSLRDSAPVEFYIPASTDEFIDLKNSKLHVTFKIVKNNGTDCGADDVVAPINDIYNGLWSNVEFFMNDRLVSHSNNTHGYTSMISHLIHDSEESLHSERQMRLLFKDTAGQLDTTSAKIPNPDQLINGFHTDNDGTAVADQGNHGLHYRYLYTRGSQPTTVIGPLRIDMCEQERYLPSGISLKLRFHRQKDNYMLMSAAANYKVKLMEAYLMMRKVKTSPGVQLGIADALLKSPAKFLITRKDTKVVAVPNGFQNFVKDNIFLGQLPKRAVIGIVHPNAFSGSVTRNPYNFLHKDVNFVQLYVDGEPVLAKALKPNVSDKQYLRCFETLFRGYDRLDGGKSCIIKREDWDKGYSLFSFDLTADYDDDDHYPIIKHGNLRLEMNFANALDSAINIIIYAEFDNIIEITSERNVQIDYT